jgi:hypothetical protein
MSSNMFMTCFHEFRIYESTNFFHEIFLVFFKNKKETFCIEIKNVGKTVYFHKRHFAAPLKENKTFFMKKNRGFVDSEFVKICHNQVNDPLQFKRQLMIFKKLSLSKFWGKHSIQSTQSLGKWLWIYFDGQKAAYRFLIKYLFPKKKKKLEQIEKPNPLKCYCIKNRIQCVS